MGDGVKLVSSALEVAKVVKEMIEKSNLNRDEKLNPVYRYYTSDSVYKFESLGNSILNHEICSAERLILKDIRFANFRWDEKSCRQERRRETVNKNVIISVKGVQTSENNDKNVLELVTEGKYYKKGNAYYVTYKESEVTAWKGQPPPLKFPTVL